MTSKRNVAATIAATVVLGLLAAVIAAGPRTASPPERSAQPDDPVAREVRELRLSVERAAARSIEVSAIVMRADASQARLSYLNSELANVRARLAGVSADIVAARIRLEEAQRPYPNTPGETTGAILETQARGQLEGLARLEEALRETEALLRADIRREQALWNGLVAKLEALERSVARGRE